MPTTVTTVLHRVNGTYYSLAFYGTDALETVELPDSVTTIYQGAFAYSGIDRLEGGSGLKSIGNYTFYHSGLQEYLIDADLETLGSSVFVSCNELRVVHIGSVPASTFSGCTSLESVAIGSSATSIGASAFSGCTSLRSITIGENVSTIGASAFNNCDALTEVAIPASVKKLSESVFAYCDNLQTVVIAPGPTSIDTSAFRACPKLETVQMPDTVRTIGDYAFYGDGALAGCGLSAALESIGTYAFADCDALTNVVMYDKVGTLGTYVYYDCDALESVTLSPALKSIPAYAFTHCDSLASIVVPYRVTSIGNYAFHDDVALVSATLPRSLTSIGTEAFNYQDRLVITGVTGTYAETYANANHFTFVGLYAPAETVVLSDTELTLEKGNYADLAVIVMPEDCTDAISWKSSNESVVTVDAEGQVYAKAIGTATVRVTVGEDGVGANCEVTVVPASAAVTLRVSLNYTSRTMNALDVLALKATVTSNTDVESVIWSSSDDTVAAVDDAGNVTALKKGSAIITATARTTGGVTAGASCTVTVSNTAHFTAAAADFASPHNYPNDCGDYWVYTSEGAERLTVTFSAETSFEPSFDYLYVYDGGKNQIGRYTGTTLAGQSVEIPGDTVIVRLVSGNSGTDYGFAVSAIEPYIFQPVPARGLSFDPTALTMQKNTRTTLYPIFDPIDTTNQEVSWSSSNPEIVSVSLDGVIIALKEGTATITATSADGGFTATVTVRVGTSSPLGDVNNDGDVDAGDAMMVMRYVVQLIDLTTSERSAADVNGDGRISAGDAVLLLRYDAGLITTFPAQN